MPTTEQKTLITPSLLDRLIDDKPEATTEEVGSFLLDEEQLKRAVARDLETLFNSRREALREVPAEFVEVNKSLLVYGLPDFTSFNLLSGGDRIQLLRSIENAIAAFEPRLERVRVSADTPSAGSRGLHFRIEALLRADPVVEPVRFDTVLQMATQEYEVKGHG